MSSEFFSTHERCGIEHGGSVSEPTRRRAYELYEQALAERRVKE